MKVVSPNQRLAIKGGEPVRDSFLPLALPRIDEDGIAEVVSTLRSGQLATGPKTEEFERRFASYVGNRFAVGVTSGSAALELALEVSGVGRGDEVITTPLTYVATAHAVMRRGAVPVFADIERRTWNIDPRCVEQRITKRTRAIVPMHFAGRPCDMERLSALAKKHELRLVSDSAHAIEGRSGGQKLAAWFSMSAFSFHPTKNLTTGEGGMVTTDDETAARCLKLLRLHGVGNTGDVHLLGQKSNMSDVQASLGLHQLARLEERHEARGRLWKIYDRGLSGVEGITLPATTAAGSRNCRHLYCILIDPNRFGCDRASFRRALQAENIGTGYHFRSLHQTSFYRERFSMSDDELPIASSVSERIVTLPLHNAMTEEDAQSVVTAVHKVAEHFA